VRAVNAVHRDQRDGNAKAAYRAIARTKARADIIKYSTPNPESRAPNENDFHRSLQIA
jgi:hypothetical protein